MFVVVYLKEEKREENVTKKGENIVDRYFTRREKTVDGREKERERREKSFKCVLIDFSISFQMITIQEYESEKVSKNTFSNKRKKGKAEKRFFSKSKNDEKKS